MVLVPAWIDNIHRVMPKGEVVPVPILCSGHLRRADPAGARRGAAPSWSARAPRWARCATYERVPAQPAPSQQVGALFLAVFGLLALASVGLVLLTLRERRTAHDEACHAELEDFRQLLARSWGWWSCSGSRGRAAKPWRRCCSR